MRKPKDPLQKRGLASKYGRGKCDPKEGVWILYREVRIANFLVYLNFAGAILQSETGSQLKVTIHPGGRCFRMFFKWMCHEYTYILALKVSNLIASKTLNKFYAKTFNYGKSQKWIIFFPEIRAYMCFSIKLPGNVFKMQYSILTFTHHFILKCITVLKFSVRYLFHYAFYLVKA